MKFDAVQFGKSIGEMLKEQVAPLRAENAKLLAANAALQARLDTIEKALDARLAAVTMKDAVIDRGGSLVLTFGDGGTKNMGVVVGKDADTAEIKAHVVTQVLKDLPKPSDGERLTAEDFRHMVADLVDVAVKALPVPKDGKDVDAVALQASIDTAVQKAVAALPKPADPKGFEPESVRHIVADLVDVAVKALPAPKDGKDVDAVALQASIDTAVQKAVAGLPKPADPKGFEPESVRHIIADLVDVAVKALPEPKPGKDFDPVAMQTAIDAGIEKAVAALPKPAEPKAFEPESVRHIISDLVEDSITRGLDSIRLPDPEPGIADAAINDKGELVLMRTDGKMIVPGRVKGQDALAVENLSLETVDGGRRIVACLKAGEREHKHEIKTATVIDRGVWKPGQYEPGDLVSLKGSGWIAQRDTSGRPGDADSGWRLSFKRGRDGKTPSRGAAA